MMAKAAALSTLRAVLRAEVEGHRALLATLKAEQEALRVGEPEAVAAIAATKLTHLGELEAVARQRTELLIACGMAVTPTGLEASAMPEALAAPVRADWERLLAIAGEAQRCNAFNGQLIARHQRHSSGALSCLLQAAGRAPVYGADGRAEHVTTGRTLASI